MISLNVKNSIKKLSILLFFQTISLYPFSKMNFNQEFNRFTQDNTANIYLLNNNKLYLKADQKGDKWRKIIDNIRKVVFDPIDSNIIYTINGNIISKSMDQGKNWIIISSGIPSIEIVNLYINPHDNLNLYVCSNNGIYETTDGGFSWNHLHFNEYINQVLINPINRNILYAISNKNLYISKDHLIWNKIDSLPKKVKKVQGRVAKEESISLFKIAFINDSTLFGLSTDQSLVKSTDNGFTWRNSSNGIRQEDLKSIHSLYINEKEILLGCRGYIIKSNDCAQTWESHKIIGCNSDIIGIYKISDKNGILIYDDSGKLVFLNEGNNKIYGLNYGILNHSTVYSINSNIIDRIQKIFVIVKNNDDLDINNYGLFVSSDSGETWIPSLIYNEPYNRYPRLFFSPLNNEIWHLIDHENSCYFSNNSGYTWTFIKQFSFAFSNDFISDFCYDLTKSNVKYFSAGVNDFSIYRYDQDNNSRVKLNVNATKMLIDSNNPNRFLTNSLMYSDNSGWTWKDISGNLPDDYEKVVDLIYFNNNYIIISVKTYNAVTDKSIMKILCTTNMGISWTLIRQLENASLLYFNPHDIKNLFIVIRDNSLRVISVMQSNDGGNTWHTIQAYQYSRYDDLGTVSNYFKCISVLYENNNKIIYIGGDFGLKKSLDNGKSWIQICPIQDNINTRIDFNNVGNSSINSLKNTNNNDKSIQSYNSSEVNNYNINQLMTNAKSNLNNVKVIKSLGTMVCFNKGRRDGVELENQALVMSVSNPIALVRILSISETECIGTISAKDGKVKVGDRAVFHPAAKKIWQSYIESKNI